MEHTRSNTAALLLKELRLSTSPLTVIFLAFTLMVFIPGYPVLVSAFFVCLGIFQSFQLARETGDIIYTALLPVRKRDVPRAKLLSVSFFQLISVLLASVFTVIRLCFMSALPPYADNPLMPACPTLIAFMLIVYAEFNYIFVRGFFRTAYRLGAPFVRFIVAAMLTVCIYEALPHLPGLGFLAATDAPGIARQLVLLAVAAVLYAVVTDASCRSARHRFEHVDPREKSRFNFRHYFAKRKKLCYTSVNCLGFAGRQSRLQSHTKGCFRIAEAMVKICK